MLFAANMYRQRRWLAIAAMTWPLLLSTGSSSALIMTSGGDKTGLTITPSQKELVVSSGLINAHTDVVITNNTGKNLDATVRLVDFKDLSDTGGLSFAQAGVPTDKYGLANWMTLPNGPSVYLPSDHAMTIPVNISNRFDLKPGGHYGAVVVTVGTGDQPGGGRTSFKQELVSLLFVTKQGGEDYGLRLESFTADTASDLPTTARLTFTSTGNVHVVPRGYITVTSNKGVVLAKGIINPESDLILPGTTKQFSPKLQTISAVKNIKQYRVTAYYRYDGQTAFTTRTLIVDGLAWLKPAVVIGVVGLVVAAVGWRYRRRFMPKPRYTI